MHESLTASLPFDTGPTSYCRRVAVGKERRSANIGNFAAILWPASVPNRKVDKMDKADRERMACVWVVSFTAAIAASAAGG